MLKNRKIIYKQEVSCFMAKNILILGGGTGGTMVANNLAKALGSKIRKNEVNILLLTESEKHIYQPGYLFVAFAHENPEHYVKKQKHLILPKINLIIDQAIRIDKDRRVVVGKNKEYSYDYLIIATGSIPRFDLIPGLAEGGNNFYSMEGAIELREKITNFTEGRIVVTLGLPHKCPVAPVELFFMLHEYLTQKGTRENVELVYTYPIDGLHLSPPVSEWLEPELRKRNIRYVTEFIPSKVDPEKRILYSKDDKTEEYDLLVSIPPHRGSQVIFNSEGLGNEMGFIDVDEQTLKAKNDNYIYVLGDATSLLISKAGSTAHYQAEYVAKNLLAELEGLSPSHHYTGKVLCFVEAGLEEATYIVMDYKNPPRPVPENQMLHWFKIAFNEMYWLSVKGYL